MQLFPYIQRYGRIRVDFTYDDDVAHAIPLCLCVMSHKTMLSTNLCSPPPPSAPTVAQHFGQMSSQLAGPCKAQTTEDTIDLATSRSSRALGPLAFELWKKACAQERKHNQFPKGWQSDHNCMPDSAEHTQWPLFNGLSSRASARGPLLTRGPLCVWLDDA